MRTKAAEGLRAVEEGTGKVLDRGGEALRRAEGILQDTKEHVSEALQKRAGRDSPRSVNLRSITRGGGSGPRVTNIFAES